MRTETTQVVTKQVEETKVTEVRCDLCGKASEVPNDWRPWANIDENAIQSTVKLKTGYLYEYGGGSGDEYSVDICPTCFLEKLIPWVESHGFGKALKRQWDK